MNTEQDGRNLADYPALSFGFVYSQIIISKCKLSELGDELVPFLRTQLFWSDQEKYSCLKVWHWKVVPFLSTMRVLTSFHQTKFQIQRSNLYMRVYFTQNLRWIWPCRLQIFIWRYISGEFDHVDYKGKKTKCRSACEDQVRSFLFQN